MKWQSIAQITGGSSVSLVLIIGLILNMSGMSYSIPEDQVCSDCYDIIHVNSTVWEIKVEHAGTDEDILFAKRMRSRTRWLNLDKINDFIETNPDIFVEILVPTTKRYATINHEKFGYLRPIKDGDSLIKRKSKKHNPHGSRFIVHGVTNGQTVKWGLDINSLLMDGVVFDPEWIGDDVTPEDNITSMRKRLSVFGGVQVTRTETQDEFIPISEEFINDQFKVCFKQMPDADKLSLSLGNDLSDGIPVTDHRTPVFKTVEKLMPDEEGKDVLTNVSEFSHYLELKKLNHLKDDCVYIPLDSEGDIHIGFTSTIYTVDKFTYGFGNNVSNSNDGVALANTHADYDSDMVLWMKFDENASDSSGLGNDGTVSGAVHNYSWYEFDGSGDYIDYENDVSLYIPDNITISIWLNAHHFYTNNYEGFILRLDSNYISPEIEANNTVYGIHLNNLENITFLHEYGGGSNEIVRSTEHGLSLNTWHHIVVVRDETNKKVLFYRDGSNFCNRTYTNSQTGGTDSTVKLKIGKSLDCNYYWSGSIDEVIIYNRSLSQAEITALYNKGLFVKSPSYGNYTSGLIDLNTTRKFKTVSWNWTGESGTNVTLRVQSASLAKPDISDEGLVGYWLDGTHGCDDVLGNNNGTAHGGVVCDGTDEGVFYGENATVFDGVDDYIKTTSRQHINSSFSVAGWVYFNRWELGSGDHQTQQVFITQNTAYWQAGAVGFWVSNEYNYLIFRIDNGTRSENVKSDNVDLSKRWVHFVGTYNTTNMKMYVDGVLRGDETATVPQTINSNKSLIIGGGNSAYEFNGSIAHVAIYNRSLSADEILNLSSWTPKLTDQSSSDISSLPDNRFYRFESILNTDNTTHTPVLQWVKVEDYKTNKIKLHETGKISFRESGNLSITH